MELLKTKKYWVAACSVLVTLFFILVLASVIYFAWIMPLLETKLLRIYGVMLWLFLCQGLYWKWIVACTSWWKVLTRHG